MCTGSIQPDLTSPKYLIRIRYKPGSAPSVMVLEPEIELCTDIHIYKNGALCLYYPCDQPWRDTNLIADTIIPWTAEWLVYYELYLITKKWEGPEIKH